MQHILTDHDIEGGFWFHLPTDDFSPRSIQTPEEYHGLPIVSIACTQTNLPKAQQAKLVKRWCQFFSGCETLQFVRFDSHVPQALFDAACTIPNLQALWIKWSNIKNIDKITNSTELKFLHIGSSTGLLSIEPLKELKNLIWLELENIKRISDLTVIGELKQLQGLEVCGSMWTTQKVDSLAPLAHLQNLRFLSLANLRAKDKTLKPLFSLSSLVQFYAADWWSETEMEQLRKANPKLLERYIIESKRWNTEIPLA